MPASRRVSGYVTFHGIMGCSRCKRDGSKVTAVPAAERKPDLQKTTLRLREAAAAEDEDWSASDVDDKGQSTTHSTIELEPAAGKVRKEKAARPPKDKKESKWHRSYRLGERRTNYSDRHCAELWRGAFMSRETTQCEEYAKATGVKWTVLLRLPYFKAARMTVPDPMHCIFMGIAKFTLHWLRAKKEWGATADGKRALAAMQRVLDDMELPADTCRILNKWASNMADLNAAQWKAFVTYLSAAVFDGRLTKTEQYLWEHLVAAAKIMSASYLRVRVRGDDDARVRPPYPSRPSFRPPSTTRLNDPQRHWCRGKQVLHDEKNKAASDTDDDYHTDPESGGDEKKSGSARHWHQARRGHDDIALVGCLFTHQPCCRPAPPPLLSHRACTWLITVVVLGW